MRFPYSLNISPAIDTGEEIVVLRPEIPVRVHGPNGVVECFALVDSGADNSIFPIEIAHTLGIVTERGRGPAPRDFGGNEIPISFADVLLEVVDETETAIRWRARAYFAEQESSNDVVVLGHEGFLDHFTATFDGAECELRLEPTGDLPATE